MQFNFKYPTAYKRITTKEVKVGNLLLGNPHGIGGHPIRVQTMTTTNTMDTIATVEQSIRCIEAGAELVRITAPSKNEAENLLNIKNELHKRGYYTPLVADIHFTPNAAEIAARIVEKVRVNPGNYVDKKKFELIEYTDADYAEEIERIQERFTPLVKICREYGTAMRIGTNHGSLSDRIMSRYGDTPMGMVESAMEFLRIARYESYHNIVLSMKSSNPQVMVAAYRLLVETMEKEFGEIYPLHLGVTEAGDGEDGRIKSAVGIGTLLEDGIGDTIRVSLTEDPELEIPVCKALVKRYSGPSPTTLLKVEDAAKASRRGGTGYYPGEGEQHPAFISLDQSSLNNETLAVNNIGGHQVPIVIADFSKLGKITPTHFESIGYTYNELTDKWIIADTAADYVFTANTVLDFALPGTLKVIVYHEAWLQIQKRESEITKGKYFPIYEAADFAKTTEHSSEMNFVMIDCDVATNIPLLNKDRTDIPYLNNNSDKDSTLTDMECLTNDTADIAYLRSNPTVVICLTSTATNAMQMMRNKFVELRNSSINNPIIIIVDSTDSSKDADEHLIHFSIEAGALLLDGMGDGICFGMGRESYDRLAAGYETTKNQSSALQNGGGRSYLQTSSVESFINNTAFGILQATRKRISKTEYISCPSCGRTLFDLQETTAKIRAVTNHLKGVKIAIMGCIVNGPGEMADADFGYVGSGPGKITLYKSKDVVKRNVPSEVAVQELINLLKESNAWVEPQTILQSTN